MFFHLSSYYELLFSQIDHEYFSTTSFLWNGLGKREKCPGAHGRTLGQTIKDDNLINYLMTLVAVRVPSL